MIFWLPVYLYVCLFVFHFAPPCLLSMYVCGGEGVMVLYACACFFFLPVFLSAWLPVSLHSFFYYLSIHLSLCLDICVYLSRSVSSVCLSRRISVCLPVVCLLLYVRPSVTLPVRPYICLYPSILTNQRYTVRSLRHVLGYQQQEDGEREQYGDPERDLLSAIRRQIEHQQR